MSPVATLTRKSGAPSPEPVSLARLAREGAALGAIVLALVFGTRVATTVALLTRFAPDQERYSKAAAAANLAHTGMLDQETGLRAFLVTHEESFLLPYSRGQKEMADGNLEVASLVGADQQLGGDVQTVEGAQQRWVDGWALPALSASDVTTGGNLPDFLTRGKLLFDDYRSYDAKLARDVSDQQAAALKSQNTALVGASLFELVLMVAAAIFGVARLRRLGRELADPVARLTAALDDLVAGRYGTRVQAGGGVSEFTPISSGVDRLGETLAALSLVAQERDQQNAERSGRQRQLLELTRDIAGSLSLRYILRSVGQSAVKVSPYDVVAVWLVEEEGRSGLLVPA
jgi:CHASE3 domain sensor protein